MPPAYFQLGRTSSFTGRPSGVVTTTRFPFLSASRAILTNPKPSLMSSVIDRFVSRASVTSSEWALSESTKFTLFPTIAEGVAAITRSPFESLLTKILPRLLHTACLIKRGKKSLKFGPRSNPTKPLAGRLIGQREPRADSSRHRAIKVAKEEKSVVVSAVSGLHVYHMLILLI